MCATCFEAMPPTWRVNPVGSTRNHVAHRAMISRTSCAPTPVTVTAAATTPNPAPAGFHTRANFFGLVLS